MLRAIEWRPVFGGLLILFGCAGAQMWMGLIHNVYMATGLLAAVLPAYLVSLYLKVLGIPIRTTLQLLSLPISFYVSILLTLQGSVDSRFFEAGVYAAIGGGFLTLCSYSKATSAVFLPVKLTQLSPVVLIVILGPVTLMSITLPEFDLWLYRQPIELLTAISALFGIVLLQDEAEDSLRKFQFAACYATVLITALAIANSLQMFYHFQVVKDWAGSIEDQILNQLLTLSGLLFGTAFYALVVLFSIAKNKTEDIMLKNWHLSEAYIFLTFMIIAPQSLYETIAGAAG
jgi:hypothetical protein